MHNSVFRKSLEHVRKSRDIKLVTTEKRSSHLVSETNYQTAKFFTENLSAKEMKKTETLMNKYVGLRLSILELSKILMHEFWYHYVKPKYDEKSKIILYRYRCICCNLKTDDIYKDIAEDVDTRFDTWNYKLDRPFLKGKIKN